MGQFWKIFFYLTGKIYIPEELKEPSITILHISDTPSMIYNDILKLVVRLKPHYLIHTGDMVDDVKLEILPQHVLKYKARANELLRKLSPHVQRKMILILGNHDRKEALEPIFNLEVYEEGKVLNIDGIKIGLSHHFEYLPENCDFYLYGHSKSVTNDTGYLNGIENINVIKIEEKRVVRLLYPSGTDNYRLRRSKIGM